MKNLVNFLASFLIVGIVLATSLTSAMAEPPRKGTALGDSITMGFAAVCQRNRNFWDLFCLLRGDRPTYSWFDGSDRAVNSVLKRYREINSRIAGNKDPARSGSELIGGRNNFIVQANQVLSQSPVPDHVEVVLGGNDICNRDCVDSRNCNNPLYSEQQWTDTVRAGLDVLVNGLPAGSTVYLGSVPRVQDLRQAGLEKQAANRRVRCESVWNTFGICRIATAGGNFNGESEAFRRNGIAARQQRYNEILRSEAQRYTTNADGQNPRGIEVIAEYAGENQSGIGTTPLTGDIINGGDCFHPNVAGQNVFAELMWNRNSDR